MSVLAPRAEPVADAARRPRAGRAAAVAVGLATATALLALVGLATGDYPLGLGDVVGALFGDAGFDSTVVRQWRAPRVLSAVVFGAALGVSGALFQSLTRNPLGSPDIIGFATGAYTGVIIMVTIVGTSAASATVGALAGGFATAIVVYVLAYRQGVLGFRLIVVGIAVTGMLHAVNLWLLLRTQAEVAMGAAIWGTGSLSLVSWGQATPAFASLLALAPFVMLALGPLRQLELGDDAAAAHGVRVEPARLGIIALGVALTAIVTAAAGPIAFVALAAPQVAKRLAGGAGLPIGHAALTGAFLLLGADLIAQRLPPGPVPVGAVTVVLGGTYLLALLVRESRRRW